jgi:hypothetical protein
MRVAIAGATGFVGTRLVEQLQTEGHQVVALVRDPAKAARLFPKTAFPDVTIVAYIPTQMGDWQQSIAGCDGVVNLAGEPIAEKRWTPEHKQLLLDSRTLTTQNLIEAIAHSTPKPSVLVNASAIGYYGTNEAETYDETSPPGRDFLAEICQAWESAADAVKAHGVRLAILRIGIVLGPGGALGKMLPVFKVFAGGPLGTGNQWFSWIHRDDLVSMILTALIQPTWDGIYNATAPNPVKMADLCTTLGNLMQRPSWLPVPAFALELLLGDGAKVVLEGQEVLPKRTLDTGFQFQYPTLKEALTQILSTNP